MRDTREQSAEREQMLRSLGSVPVALLSPYTDAHADAKARGTFVRTAAAARRARVVLARWLSDRFSPGRSESVASRPHALHLARPRGHPAAP